jgi:hypothetical protein
LVEAAQRSVTVAMQLAGWVEKTHDKDYEAELRRFHNVKSLMTMCKQQTASTLVTWNDVVNIQLRVVETIDRLEGMGCVVPAHNYEKHPQHSMRDLKEALQTIQSNQLATFDTGYRLTVLQAFNTYCNTFTAIDQVARKRAHKLVDVDGRRSTVKRIKEKRPLNQADLTQAEQKLASAQETYDHVNHQLKEDLAHIVQLRAACCDAALEASIKLHYAMFNGCLHEMQQNAPQQDRGNPYDVLKQMNRLAIASPLQ